MPRVADVEVYLVGHDLYAVPEAHFAHALQLVARPDAAGRVLRTAQYVQLDVFLRDLPLHVLEVEDVSALQLQKVAADKAASVLLYCAVKRRIGGVIEQYAVPWLRQRAHAAADCQHQAVGLEEPLRLYPPAVAARHPGAYLTLQALRRS